MGVIKRITRWVLLLASLAFMVPFPSDGKERIEWGNVLISILMAALALDMFLLILGLRRKRLQVLLEFVLYPAFIVLLIFRLIKSTSSVVASLMNDELSTLGAGLPLLILFVVICGLLIASAFVALIDAKNSHQGI